MLLVVGVCFDGWFWVCGYLGWCLFVYAVVVVNIVVNIVDLGGSLICMLFGFVGWLLVHGVFLGTVYGFVFFELWFGFRFCFNCTYGCFRLFGSCLLCCALVA